MLLAEILYKLIILNPYFILENMYISDHIQLYMLVPLFKQISVFFFFATNIPEKNSFKNL